MDCSPSIANCLLNGEPRYHLWHKTSDCLNESFNTITFLFQYQNALPIIEFIKNVFPPPFCPVIAMDGSSWDNGKQTILFSSSDLKTGNSFIGVGSTSLSTSNGYHESITFDA